MLLTSLTRGKKAKFTIPSAPHVSELKIIERIIDEGKLKPVMIKIHQNFLQIFEVIPKCQGLCF